MNKFIDEIKKYNIAITGRASTAIYAILKSLNIYDKSILVPSNICYAAVYPILLSGNRPLFVDVDRDGNLNLDIIKSYKNEINVAIIPHMYGNICLDIEKISIFLRENKILMIEDCASSLGAMINNRQCGTFGDYGIFSFGYSKTLDLGGGGMIISKNKLLDIELFLKTLPLYNLKIEEKLYLFSKLYRLFRNSNTNSFILNIYNNIIPFYRDEFIYRNTSKKQKEILISLNNVEFIVETRQKKQQIYLDYLDKNNNYEIYHFHEGSVPWRFNLLIVEKYQKSFLEYALYNSLPISDWYPVVVDMFNESKEKYVNAYKFEKMIVNFPLLLEEDEILNICNHINNFFKDLK